MPPFYFDVSEGEHVTHDAEGLQLESLEAAEREAIRTAGEIACEALPKRPNSEVSVLVRDEDGVLLLAVGVAMTVRRLAHAPCQNWLEGPDKCLCDLWRAGLVGISVHPVALELLRCRASFWVNGHWSEKRLMPHAFQVGDRVHFNSRVAPQSTVESFLEVVTIADYQATSRTWIVERCLPLGPGGYQYHIRCCENGRQRLVSEAQITPVLEPSPSSQAKLR
jgi:hypothetical protein